MVAPALVAAGKMAGKYIIHKGKKAIVKAGRKVIRKGVKAVAKKAGVTYSKDKSAMGAVNMVKKGMIGPKATHEAAYNPEEMKNTKREHAAASGAMGGPGYTKNKFMGHGQALSYTKSAAVTKTRK